MPAFDGTGPSGRGRRTGHGRGLCIDRTSGMPRRQRISQPGASGSQGARFWGLGPGQRRVRNPGSGPERAWRRRPPR
ncbi:MAG: DUF5320 family protein [Firmicutes bacterium]|nr:DUF5320 family protein [Bacillota bacterium]